ncbi:probable tRNA-splicing endonuclease subunit sen34 [Chrysoperla carnea]|uniref:probable tRNA-splicing endonuclease subunit sen34 n=1 Tax=Chrysoperla carnea TaxID=189513 RepID=UPI001D08C193|nr:probable tRNA-splicing endonuclease subunit sen34 [Chrysoperla carnea]XP_044732651.1 probable tRNA-splicing endonuclease subunit sen34 [Chrysoperla carnea]XP_044732652.1 probable tRNA-splicing endonuclease subunit sen34 [Chrysoperla carnea]
MIDLTYQNESFMVFDEDVWAVLRTEHRIIGFLIGCLPTLPRQNIFHGLPMKLMPEQALLLVDKNIARVVKWNRLNQSPDMNAKVIFEKNLADSQKQQNESFKIKRKIEITNNLDKIIEMKQKKGRKNIDNLSKEQILDEECKKIPDITFTNMLTPLCSNAPDYLKGEFINIPLTFLKEKVNPIRYKVFTDLWDRGYYVTDGLTFGGDFLVYEGDPSIFHASSIIKCVDDFNYNFNVPEIVSLGRLGNSVKKKMVLAAIQETKICYLTLTWENDD